MPFAPQIFHDGASWVKFCREKVGEGQILEEVSVLVREEPAYGSSKGRSLYGAVVGHAGCRGTMRVSWSKC